MEKSLRINAYFSSLSGLLLIVLNSQMAKLFGTSNNSIFWIVGIALIYFAGTIIFEIKRLRPLAILWIIIQDFTWVATSFFILIVSPFEISKEGNGIIAIVALVVLFMGMNQAKALSKLDSVENKRTKYFRFERKVNSTKQNVWKVISDVSNYHKVAPNIDDVKIISGKGNGMVRSCSHGKDSWTETCTMWNEEKSYSFEVNTASPDYPYPFKFLKGTWEIEVIDASHSNIVMVFEFQYKRKFQNWLLHPFLKGKFKKTAEELLDNWQSKLELPAAIIQ